jgi:hypothetical protein
MKKRISMKKRLGLTVLMMTLVLMMASTSARSDDEIPRVLSEAKQKITAELHRLDTGLKKAAENLGQTGLTSDQARRILANLCGDFDYAADCAAVDMQGKMVTIEPAPYRQFEGKDIYDQEQVQRILKSGKPVLSSVFRSVEGFPAVDVEYPVVTSTGKRLGQVSVLFQPEKMLGKIIAPLVQGTPSNIWVMEKKGRILYDADNRQIGLHLFTSSLYSPNKSLILLGRRISALPEGKGIYRFRRTSSSEEVVVKNAAWQSVSLYGNDWRLVAIHVEKPGADPTGKELVVAATLEKQLEDLVALPALKKALSTGDTRKGLKILKNFYEEAPGIYSVQWMDAKGINRLGYPEDNSLLNYDYHSRRMKEDPDFLKILEERKPAVYETPLFEGKTGAFTFRPVFQRDRYLGMVYFIKLK